MINLKINTQQLTPVDIKALLAFFTAMQETPAVTVGLDASQAAKAIDGALDRMKEIREQKTDINVSFHTAEGDLETTTVTENGPEFSDGCDHEGFPGGCERFGHTHNPVDIFGGAKDAVNSANEALKAFDSDAPAIPEPPTVDSAGLPWDARIHSSSKAIMKNGEWRKMRGVDEDTVNAVTDELRGKTQWVDGKAPESSIPKGVIVHAPMPPVAGAALPMPPVAYSGPTATGIPATMLPSAPPMPPVGVTAPVPPLPPVVNPATALNIPPAPAIDPFPEWIGKVTKHLGSPEPRMTQARFFEILQAHGVNNMFELYGKPDAKPGVMAAVNAEMCE